MTAAELCASLGGTLLAGRGEAVITGCHSLAEAGPDDLSFFGNEKYLPALRGTRAGVVLVPDVEILAAQRFLWDEVRLIAEPGGAAALAGLLSGRAELADGARVGVVVAVTAAATAGSRRSESAPQQPVVACPACGAVRPVGDNFCGACGKPLKPAR